MLHRKGSVRIASVRCNIRARYPTARFALSSRPLLSRPAQPSCCGRPGRVNSSPPARIRCRPPGRLCSVARPAWGGSCRLRRHSPFAGCSAPSALARSPTGVSRPLRGLGLRVDEDRTSGVQGALREAARRQPNPPKMVPRAPMGWAGSPFGHGLCRPCDTYRHRQRHNRRNGCVPRADTQGQTA